MALSGPQVRRLDERLDARSRGLTPQQYLNFLKSPSGALELEELINAVVVHKTDLFRDEVQLAAFRAEVLAPLVDGARRPLRVWSAGCATGEEVATLLVMLAELGADPGSTVLGTDISVQALRRAQTLGFTPEQVRRVPPALRERYFVETAARVVLVPALRARANFQLHNLMDTPYPVPAGGGGFDVIFCRNVLIYFTPEAFQRTVEVLAASLAPGGTLVLSSSEPLLRLPPSLRVLRGEQAFFYVRAEDSGGGGGGLALPVEGGRKRDSGRFAAVSTEAKPPEAEPTPGRTRDSGRFAAIGAGMETPTVEPAPGRTRDSGRFAAINAGMGTPTAEPAPGRTRDSGRFAAIGAGTPTAGAMPPTPTGPVDPASTEADLLFACVLDGASTGTPDDTAERDLRRCLALDPDHAAARYLLGLLLEQGGRPAEAAAEYRRALQSLEAGRARPVPFFLNPSRLQVACAHAAERLEAAGRSR
ncbi:protein-glutamate O-methyltransferase CheR [Myxococcus sp. RHSTA-1-4]|uniref:CheR family methyltransferase n=1 Tax=Myxococcus sp. RHSTA-1-4 TaxID=2874601 RepID=UPI001CBEEB63|nr:CheR family methyltransferase [Myxococcus sp. RHSTA-1-4]MBZ4418905.1 tetratricopeptide repeat protein [Myxococcus sp. RHSTA-1-4]